MAPANPLSSDVLALLKKKTGLDDAEAWRNVWLLISKSEQNNEDPNKAFLTDTGKSLFGYASALSYDQHKRGVTIGIVGWTTGNNSHDGKGDAPELFRVYTSLGGEDLMPYCDGCCKSKDKCAKLISKIKDIQDDPKWIQAQWQQLTVKDGYIYETMAAFKKIGIDNPSALAIATVFDTSLNQGFDGPDGGCDHLVKLGVKGNEDKTLKAYNAWRRKVAGTSEYNDPFENGVNRADMYEELRKAKVCDLKGADATKAIKKAISWNMK